jgi:phosphate transport system permease protein
MTETAKVRVIDQVQASLGKRYAREKRFRAMGLGAVILGMLFVTILFVNIVSKGYTAFWQTQIALDIKLDEQVIDPSGARKPEELARADYAGLVKSALREVFPDVTGRRDKRDLYGIVSSGASFQLARMVKSDPTLVGTTQRVWVPADDDIDMLIKGNSTRIDERSYGGIASPTGTTGTIKVLTTSNDFTRILDEVKGHLAKQAERQLREVERKQRLVGELNELAAKLEQRLAAAEAAADEVRTQSLGSALVSAQQQRSAAEGELAQLRETAAELQRRATTPGGEEALPPDLPSYLVSINGGLVKATSVSNSGITGEVYLPLQSQQDAAVGNWKVLVFETPENSRRVKDRAVAWVWDLERRGLVEQQFNVAFFTNGDSREPELAGIGGAVMGSVYTLLVTLLLSFPIGVAAAVYLEEFAPKNRWTDLIEVNINNLAAVPSIVFGLLGLAVFINFFTLPRSAPLVGGLVLTLMTLPTIIIASRAALKSVPPSIREAALGVGASRMQAMFHHVLPLAMPGMLTGTIIGMAQALGESAPLLMIGMVAFIVDIPGGPLDPSTVLPVQIFLWADSPERAFVERTSAAIMVLLAFLITMNALAVILRKRFERRW